MPPQCGAAEGDGACTYSSGSFLRVILGPSSPPPIAMATVRDPERAPARREAVRATGRRSGSGSDGEKRELRAAGEAIATERAAVHVVVVMEGDMLFVGHLAEAQRGTLAVGRGSSLVRRRPTVRGRLLRCVRVRGCC